MTVSISKSQYPGVRFRENPDRKFNGKPDRYFFIRYYHANKLKEEGCGWSSEGWNAGKANLQRSELVNNNRLGVRPMTLKEKREMDIESRVAEATEKQIQDSENVSFDTLAQDYMIWSESKKKSFQHDCTRYNLHVKSIIGHLPAKKVSPIHLDAIRISMKKNHSPKTIHHVLSLVRSIFFKSIERGTYQGKNPVMNKIMPKFDNGRVRHLTTTESKLLLDTLKIKCRNAHDKTVLGLFCGMRYSEIAKLSWENVNLGEQLISVMDTKTDKNRHIYFGKNVADMFLSRIVDAYPSTGLIFPSSRGGILTQMDWAFQEVADALFNQNVADSRQRVVFHTTRHTFCSMLVMNGVDLNTVMALSGHKTFSCVLRYSHLSSEHQKNAVNALSDNFDSDNRDNVISLADRKAG
jgi:site-specific recombinase XerD